MFWAQELEHHLPVENSSRNPPDTIGNNRHTQVTFLGLFRSCETSLFGPLKQFGQVLLPENRPTVSTMAMRFRSGGHHCIFDGRKLCSLALEDPQLRRIHGSSAKLTA